MPTVYGDDIPRYTKEDEASLANQHLDDTTTETITVRDLYENRHVAALVPLQELVFEQWHFWRIFTIGDAAHKGGNGAVESAAVLVNAIVRKTEEHPEGLSEEALDAAFGEVYTDCHGCARAVVKQEERMQSITNLEGPFSGLLIRYLVLLFGDALFLNSLLKTSLAGPRIEKMDTAPRPHTATFNDEQVTQSGKCNRVLWSAVALVSGLVFMLY